jgi:hypothetical protein
MQIELLWFEGCPNHQHAETLVQGVLAQEHIDARIQRIQVDDEETGKVVCFPGSPTIRINGRDVEPGWAPCEDCTPRCRVYPTAFGLQPLPERDWIVSAVRTARALSA